MGLDLISSITSGLMIKCSRWREASKCKKLMKLVKHRLIIQTNRRNTMMRQLREDIAQLLQNGHNQSAFARVLQLHKDQHILLAYERLEFFCDYVLNNIDEITSHRKLSGDVYEAVSSLIFAASRCGNLPELQSLRYFFKGIFGQKFERANVELLPGNCVNSELKHSLSIKSIPENVKTQIVNEILREIKQKLGEPVEVEGPTFFEDGSDGIKDQIQTNLSENMSPETEPNFDLRDCKKMVNHWSISHDGSYGMPRSFATTETNTTIIQEKNVRNFTTGNRTIATTTEMDAAIPCCHDKTEQPLQGEDFSRDDQLTNIDSLNGMRRIRRPPYLKAVNENFHESIKKYPMGAINCRSSTSAVAESSQNEGVVRNECSKDTKAIHRSPHVHPKLPEYDDLVLQFRNLKERASGRKTKF